MRLWWADTGLDLSLLAVMVAAAHNSMAGLAPLPTAMDAAACLRAVADLLENALLAHAVSAYPGRRQEGTVQMAGRGYGGQVVSDGAVGGPGCSAGWYCGRRGYNGSDLPERMILV